MTNTEAEIKIFLSYSHIDEKYLNRLKTTIKPLQRQGLISSWYDRHILPGTEWSSEIDQNIDSADIIILLISPDFLASDYCCGVELIRAETLQKEGRSHIIPILIRPTDVTGFSFMNFMALPKDKNPITKWEDQDDAWLDVSLGIRALIEKVRINKIEKMQTERELAREDQNNLAINLKSIIERGVYCVHNFNNSEISKNRSTWHLDELCDDIRCPLKSSLRMLINMVIKNDDVFDGFCRENFLSTQRRFTNKLSRSQKITMLLSLEDPKSVLKVLREVYPVAVKTHQEIIKYEEIIIIK